MPPSPDPNKRFSVVVQYLRNQFLSSPPRKRSQIESKLSHAWRGKSLQFCDIKAARPCLFCNSRANKQQNCLCSCLLHLFIDSFIYLAEVEWSVGKKGRLKHLLAAQYPGLSACSSALPVCGATAATANSTKQTPTQQPPAQQLLIDVGLPYRAVCCISTSLQPRPLPVPCRTRSVLQEGPVHVQQLQASGERGCPAHSRCFRVILYLHQG